MAKELLLKEASKHKSVIIISNGQSTTCHQPGVVGGDEKDIADGWHSAGVNVIYVGIGELANKTNIDNIATDPKHEKIIPDINKEEPDQLQKIVNWMLDLVNKDAEDPCLTTS
ncbi:hypothetical protein COOONC_02338 [Cooperia oncophora]